LFIRTRLLMARLQLIACSFALLLLAATARADVIRVVVETRDPVLQGQRFGAYGPYELVRGRILFGFDPANPMNARIVDLGLAPRNADGLVEAWAPFVVLQPVDPQHGRGVALVEVSNRGGTFSPRYFNLATTSNLDPASPEAFGDALLMRLGLSVIWVGWQFDVPPGDDLLRLDVPQARSLEGEPLYGLVRSDWVVDEPAMSLPVSHRNHRPYPAVDFNDPAHVLTVRDGRDAPRRIVPRDGWRFAREDNGRAVPDSTHIYLTGGFEPGKIYELVYRAGNPAVVGLGLAAIRDVIAYAKYDPASLFPARYGLAVGVSQTGRFLRHFLYQGFNTDTQGRRAYDGLMIITAGAGRGSFNHRFAQPSRDAHRFSAFFYPTDLFPFTSRVQEDAQQGRTDGLLAHLHNPDHAPKTFYLNTGYEYWARGASLLHTTPDGTADVPPLPQERIYHLAAGQHFPGGFPPPDQARMDTPPTYRGNPLDFGVNYRALLVRLVEWVADDKTPPPSAYPRRDDGTLVPIDAVAFPPIPGLTLPKVIHVAYRADYGPRWPEGIIDLQPPKLGSPFPSLVSQVDSLGNEAAGVRNVALRVPLATYTPWNLRTGLPGPEGELTDFYGSYSPLPRTDAERAQRRDPRPSLEALYADKRDYLSRVWNATQALIDEGFLLPDDRSRVIGRAAEYWDWIFRD